MNIILLGSGNVATHLGKAFKSVNHKILQVWSRNFEHALVLAEELGAAYTSDISSVLPDADLYVVSVSDDHIADVVRSFPHSDKILVHTSGSTEMDIRGISGVFYPLQTFSKHAKVDFDRIPIAVEAIDQGIESCLFALAQSIGSKPFILNSEQRKALHVAAVFACNFTNHLYNVANGILQNQKLSFDLIRPLIDETARKVQNRLPSEVQTGPAIRNDQKILDKHLHFLQGDQTLADLYDKLSQSIINFNQKA